MQWTALRDPQTWNRYSYARNNPLSIVDPTGLYDLHNPCAQGDEQACSITNGQSRGIRSHVEHGQAQVGHKHRILVRRVPRLTSSVARVPGVRKANQSKCPQFTRELVVSKLK